MFINIGLLGLIFLLAGCGGSGSAPSPAGTSQEAPLNLTGTVSTIAGAAANFSLPVGITSDNKYLYIADCDNNTIRKIDISTGTVTTVAGTGELGTVDDGPGTLARFNHPRGIATDGTWLYVTEMVGNIRKVRISSGKVSTIDTSAKLSLPTGITTDKGNLYVTDSADHVISKIVIASGIVTTFAGTASTSGFDNGIGTAATFNQPVGITTDGTNLYVNDLGNSAVRKIVIASGKVSTVAGAAEGLKTPEMGIATDGTNLYVADYYNHIISKIIISSGVVTTLAGSAGTAGFADTVPGISGALFYNPEGITSDGKSLFISDSHNNAIRKLH